VARRPPTRDPEPSAAPDSPPPGAEEGAADLSPSPELREAAEAVTRRKYRKRRKAPEPAQEEPSNEILSSQLAGMLRAIFKIGATVASWWGYDLDPLTKPEAQEGADYWLPLARRVPWIVSLAVLLAGPAWLLAMLREKLHRKEKAAKEAKSPEPEKSPASIEMREGPFPRGA
jgi:hypothetical protein